jgi:hypothetical protein
MQAECHSCFSSHACLLATKKKKRKKKDIGIGIASKRCLSQGGSIPLHLIDPPPRRKKEKKKKTPESVCHAQIGTSQTNPCNPEQGRKTKAEDAYWYPSFYEEALNTP